MEKIVVSGGAPLFGQVEISGSKNAALPIIYACVLVKGKCILENIPDVSDIRCSFEILKGIGAKVKMLSRGVWEVDCTDVEAGRSDYELVIKEGETAQITVYTDYPGSYSLKYDLDTLFYIECHWGAFTSVNSVVLNIKAIEAGYSEVTISYLLDGDAPEATAKLAVTVIPDNG